MIKIIVDAMGGDCAPQSMVYGCIEAVKKQEGFQVLLTGDEPQIRAILNEQNYEGNRIEIYHTTELVTNDDEPSKIVKRKKDSSMVVAFRLLKEGKGDAVLSCGSTGALLACSIMVLNRIRGVLRPALGTLLPTASGSTLLLDCGLNAICKPTYYPQFAIMGSLYIKYLLGIEAPKVGLLNIGVETRKGPEYVQEAFQLLEQEEGLHFIGNMEGNEVIAGRADVVVTDGFSGNILLKGIEGTAAFFVKQLKDIFHKNPITNLSGLMVQGELQTLKQTVDVDVLGGAPILGVDGLVVKSHGNSKARTIEHAVLKCVALAKTNMVEELKKEFEKRRVE